MFTALDAPPDRLDDHEKNFVAQVREHGWFGTHVFADEESPGFFYTTGFWLGLNMPEIIVFSLKREVAHALLWQIYRDASSGASFPDGARLSNVIQDGEVVLLPVSKPLYPEYLGWSRWFYGNDDWPCLQLVWPDPNGKFPWEETHDAAYRDSQPNLTGEAWPV